MSPEQLCDGGREERVGGRDDNRFYEKAAALCAALLREARRAREASRDPDYAALLRLASGGGSAPPDWREVGVSWDEDGVMSLGDYC